jgi:tetrapyrrole methylase family protein/MazG family protein
MVRRHPHVFAQVRAKNKEQVWRRWEAIKKAEAEAKAKAKELLAGIPKSLPALYRAEKVQKRAARVGFDWDRVAGAWDKVREELDEVYDLLKSKVQDPKSKTKPRSQFLKLKEEIGDLLFAIVNVARKLDLDAEEALQGANNKFVRRFAKIEAALLKKKLTLKEMDRLWARAKAAEK